MAKKSVTKNTFRKHREPAASIVDYKGVFTWKVLYTVEDVKAAIGDKKVLAFDTETTGLDYGKLRIAGYSFSTNGIDGYYVPISHKKGKNAPREALDFIVSYIRDEKNTILMFNKKYDLNVLEISENYGMSRRLNVKCVQALIWLRDTDYTMPSLKFSSEHFLGVIQPRFGEVTDNKTFDYIEAEDACEYASLDAICTYQLCQLTMRTHPQLKPVYAIDDKAIEVVRHMEYKPIRLSEEWLRKEADSVLVRIKNIEKQVFSYAGYEFNINSGVQLANMLISIGIVLTDKTESGKWSTAESSLEKIEHPIGALLIEYSKLQTYNNTFVKNLLEQAEKNGSVRYNYKTCSVVTGRFSSGGDEKNTWYAPLNGQNVPKPNQVLLAAVPDDKEFTGWRVLPLEDVFEKESMTLKNGFTEAYVVETGTDAGLRSAFLPDDEDSLWVSIDYAGQELRIAANFSGEPTFVDAFNSGSDPHMMTAKKIYGEHADKNHRRMAKGANFALQYGGSAYTLQGNLGISKSEATDVYDKYRKSMPVLIEWQDYMVRTAKRTGTITSAFGREFHLGRFFDGSATWKQQSYGERCALNYPVQGTGGDVVKIALGRVFDYYGAMQDRNIDGFTYKSTIHDEINFSVKKYFMHNFMKTVPQLMYMMFDGWHVPLTVDVGIGSNWGEAVSYKYDIESRKYTPKGDYYTVK
jgi:DNA polymerase-1